MHSMQVHAISSKASDVRAVVMDLNAKRQAAEEQGDANDHSSPPRTDEKHAKKEAVSAVAWQDYNEACVLPLDRFPAAYCSLPGPETMLGNPHSVFVKI